MTKLKEYIVNADSWVTGRRRKSGDVVELTTGQAKYEDVTLKADESPRVEKASATPKKKAS